MVSSAGVAAGAGGLLRAMLGTEPPPSRFEKMLGPCAAPFMALYIIFWLIVFIGIAFTEPLRKR